MLALFVSPSVLAGRLYVVSTPAVRAVHSYDTGYAGGYYVEPYRYSYARSVIYRPTYDYYGPRYEYYSYRSTPSYYNSYPLGYRPSVLGTYQYP